MLTFKSPAVSDPFCSKRRVEKLLASVKSKLIIPTDKSESPMGTINLSPMWETAIAPIPPPPVINTSGTTKFFS